MAGWLVTQGDRQFQARDLSELKQLAAAGDLGPSDMVQPPGANDWLYAGELEDLKDLFPSQSTSTLDDDWEMPQKSRTPAIIVLAILVVLPFLVFVMEVALQTLRAVIVRGALGALLPTGTEGEQDRKKLEGVELHLGISLL